MSTASTISAWRIFAVSSPSSPSRNLQVRVIVALKLPNKKWVSRHHNQKREPHKAWVAEAHIRVHSPRFFSKQKLRSSSSDTCFLFLCFSRHKSASGLGLRMWYLQHWWCRWSGKWTKGCGGHRRAPPPLNSPRHSLLQPLPTLRLVLTSLDLSMRQYF